MVKERIRPAAGKSPPQWTPKSLVQDDDPVAGGSTDDDRSAIEEMRLRQIKLELQIEELRRSQANLKQARDRYIPVKIPSSVYFGLDPQQLS